MKGWTGSINLCVMGKISTLAPNLEVLHVHIQNQGRKNQGQLCNLSLTSAMRSVDVVFNQWDGDDTGSLVLQRLPSDELTHLRIECVSLSIHHELYSWIISRPNINLIGFEACTILTDQKPIEQNQGERYEDFNKVLIRRPSTVEGQLVVLLRCVCVFVWLHFYLLQADLAGQSWHPGLFQQTLYLV